LCPPSDFHERPHGVPNHVTQKTVGSHLVLDQFRLRIADGGSNDRARRRRHIAVRSLKGSEVAASLETTRRGAHRFDIERTDDVPGVAAFERTEHRAVRDSIPVRLRPCVEPRVKRRRHDVSAEHPHRLRQLRIQRTHERVGRNRVVEREARHLAERMDARVSAAGADHRHVAIDELAQRVFENALD
jgi:hypothetical protein